MGISYNSRPSRAQQDRFFKAADVCKKDHCNNAKGAYDCLADKMRGEFTVLHVVLKGNGHYWFRRHGCISNSPSGILIVSLLLYFSEIFAVRNGCV